MKKLLILVVCLTFFGCGSSDDDKETVTKITSMKQLEELKGVVWELPEYLFSGYEEKLYMTINNQTGSGGQVIKYIYDLVLIDNDSDTVCTYSEWEAVIDSKGLIYSNFGSMYSTLSLSSNGNLEYTEYDCESEDLNNCTIYEKFNIPLAPENLQGEDISMMLCR